MKPDQFTGMLSVYRPPLVYELAGRKFTLVFDDGYDRTLVFKDRRTITFGPEGNEKDYPYECLKIGEKCYFVSFEDPEARPRAGIVLVLALVQDLVTMALAYIGTNPKLPGLPSDQYIFGAIQREDGTISNIRHGYTTDLFATAVDWNYGHFDIAHVYATEHYYRVSFSARGLARAYRGRPDLRQGNAGESRKPAQSDVYEDYCTVIRIRDRIYLVGLLETVKARRSGHGNSILVLMNLDEMHDVGRSFGSNAEGGTGNNTLGAFGVFHDASEVLAKPSTLYTR